MLTIPDKFYSRGDLNTARSLIGEAKRQLRKLKHGMSFQKLPTGSSQVTLSDGTIIFCTSSYGESKVYITVPTGGEQFQEEAKVCICNCNLTIGWITKVQTGSIGSAKLYTVAACFNSNKYKIIEDVLASDFTEYQEDQMIILVPYNEMSYLCCNGSQTPSGCNPIEPTEPLVNITWRTTLRILPWCGVTIPKWLELGED